MGIFKLKKNGNVYEINYTLQVIYLSLLNNDNSSKQACSELGFSKDLAVSKLISAHVPKQKQPRYKWTDWSEFVVLPR